MIKKLAFGKISHIIPDSLYLRLMYKYIMGESLHLRHPKTSNEKMQWIKLNDRKAIYTTMADKYESKNYIDSIIGPGHTLKTYAVWNSIEEVSIDELPKQFVLKNTRGKGVVICKDKDLFDLAEAKKTLGLSFNKNLYWYAREWPYKNIKPRVIAEEYISNGEDVGLIDYKVSCYEGEPKYIETIIGRFTSNGINEKYYDFSWNELDYRIEAYEPGYNLTIPAPLKLDEMYFFSKLLSENTHYLRVDWYVYEDELYVGELTFFDEAGFVKWIPREFANTLGNLINI